MTINEETGMPVLNECIDSLKKYVENPPEKEELATTMETLIKECSKSVPHRVLAAKNNAHIYILSLINRELDQSESHPENSTLHKMILCNHAMTSKNPDIFDGKSLEIIIKVLDTQKNKNIICDVLKWIQKACLLHEMNRQTIVNEDILLKHLKPLLTTRDEPEIIKNVCMTFRFLILDGELKISIN